ncbi:MAG: DEAD/DEAH box helicase [Bacteroidetes bacterium]|nr:DEAD/DEAH box helicase [Bacteroidota bacterium]
MSFKQLNLIEPLLKALEIKGYDQPTPIQEQSIPHILQGRDIFGCAQTGTGKTAAFVLPMLQLLTAKAKQGNGVRALILAPTRELALQISDSITTYRGQLPIKHTLLFGGVSQRPQVASLQRHPDIIVATPGRLLDLMEQGYVSLKHLDFLVLDEADRMLDMGFIRDIRKIIAVLPAKRHTLFFSATAAPEIMKLANQLLNNPIHVSVSPVSSTAEAVKQAVYYVKKEDKRLLLKHVLTDKTIEHVLVFTRTKRGADRVAKDLNALGIRAEAIHGNKSQNAREKALQNFKQRRIRVLVATDIASRGIDVQQLSHVINYEIPEQAETYVHRIGRTGRAGNSGIALSFCTNEERPYMRDINKLIKKQVEVVAAHPFS